MPEAFLVDGVRTPIGRYGGALAGVRPDDLAALVLASVVSRSGIDPALIDDVILGGANQAGEDNRNVARMAVLLAGLPDSVPGITVNRLCASGLSAVHIAANMVKAGEADLVIAGGVESMTRAPWVLAKPEKAFAKPGEIVDTSIGWRFTNPRLTARDKATFSMPETAEEVASSRRDQQSGCRRVRAALAPAGRGRAGRRRLRAGDRRRADEGRPRPERRRPPVRDHAGEAGRAAPGRAPRRRRHRRQRQLPQRRRVAPSSSPAKRRSPGSGSPPAPASSARRERRRGAGDHGPRPRPGHREAPGRAGPGPWATSTPSNSTRPSPPSRWPSSGGSASTRRSSTPTAAPSRSGTRSARSGTRILVTLLGRMEREGARRGLATMCVGVGQGAALLVERV